MKTILTILFLTAVHTFPVFCQDSLTVQFTILNKQDKSHVNRAKITIDDSICLYSNAHGEAFFKTTPDRTLHLDISHGRYNDVVLVKKVGKKSSIDTVFINIQLAPLKTQLIDEAYVTAAGIPVVVYGSDSLSVSDFEILDNGRLLLLTYPKRLSKSNDLVILEGKRLISRFSIDERAEELIRDYRGNPFLVCRKNVYGIRINEDNVELLPVEKNYYMKYIAPIVDTNQTKMYFSNYSEDIPRFDYFSFDQEDSSYYKIQTIQDDLMMELYRSEYKYVDVRTKLWAKNLELETGIDAELWVGANYFTQSIYYKSLYAPMFNRNDSLIVLDHYNDLLRVFSSDGIPVDSVEIHYHYNKKKTGFKNSVIQDSKTQEIYVFFDRAGYTYISVLDVSTGNLGPQIRLTHRYIENLTILNNQAYYVYRPFESAQKKFLYREGLPR